MRPVPLIVITAGLACLPVWAQAPGPHTGGRRGGRAGNAPVVHQTSDAHVTPAPPVHFEKQLQIVSGNDQPAFPGQPLAAPIILRLADTNELGYAGVKIRATASDGDTVEPEVTTDEAGLVRFHWKPGPGPLHELKFTAGNNGPSAQVEALGPPQFTSSAAPEISPGGTTKLSGYNLAGATVMINGEASKVTASSNRDITFVVPNDIAAGDATIAVWNMAGATSTVPAKVVGQPQSIIISR